MDRYGWYVNERYIEYLKLKEEVAELKKKSTYDTGLLGLLGEKVSKLREVLNEMELRGVDMKDLILMSIDIDSKEEKCLKFHRDLTKALDEEEAANKKMRLQMLLSSIAQEYSIPLSVDDDFKMRNKHAMIIFDKVREELEASS